MNLCLYPLDTKPSVKYWNFQIFSIVFITSTEIVQFHDFQNWLSVPDTPGKINCPSISTNSSVEKNEIAQFYT